MKRMSTPEHIAYVTERLMKNRSIESINVADIIDAAEISRTTFYRYFLDKYDVIIWSYKNKFSKLLADGEVSYRFNTGVLTTMYENKDFFETALKYRGQNSLLDFITSITYENSIETVKRKSGMKELPRDLVNTLFFYCGGCIELTRKWIEAGMIETPNEIARIIHINTPTFLKEYFEE